MTALPTVELLVYPHDCDAFGHLNHAAVLVLLERARWKSLAQGPGMDLFHRNGVAPVVRKAVVEYRAAAFPTNMLRVESAVVHRGTTSWTIHHTATRVADGVLIAEADIVFVCLDRVGRPTPLPEEMGRLFGARTTSATGGAARHSGRRGARCGGAGGRGSLSCSFTGSRSTARCGGINSLACRGGNALPRICVAWANRAAELRSTRWAAMRTTWSLYSMRSA